MKNHMACFITTAKKIKQLEYNTATIWLIYRILIYKLCSVRVRGFFADVKSVARL